jgi:hypothetical protein
MKSAVAAPLAEGKFSLVPIKNNRWVDAFFRDTFATVR